MAELRRLEHHRFVGTRDDMIVYDTDDADQAALLGGRLDSEDLVDQNLIQTFGPDDLAEARNRGFRSPGVSR